MVLMPSNNCAKEYCESKLRTKVDVGNILENGTLQATDEDPYPADTFWMDENTTWACPCLLGPCIRLCSGSKNMQTYAINKHLKIMRFNKIIYSMHFTSLEMKSEY
jgi:hypothetical protein